jgi:hypothetical protein
MLFAHELYHGLQDQHFDLDAYMRPDGHGESNNDQVLARQAVVDQYAMGRTPTHATIEPIVRMQSALDLQTVTASLQRPQVAAALGADIQAATEASQGIPPFIMDMMMGAYLKGLGFVFEVHRKGWTEVEKLYREYPPGSTEQILHPDKKWFAREAPLTIEFPSLQRARALEDWDVLEENSVGEFLWRAGTAIATRCSAQGQRRSPAVAQHGVGHGSGCDRVRECLSAAARSEIRTARRADAHRAPRQAGLVVEGGTERSLSELMKFVKQAKKRRT